MFKRNTIIATQVLEILKSADTPLSVPAILAALTKQGLSPNKTTIYRILEKLMKDNTVTEISIRNKGNVYEIQNGHHHHHFICNNCETVYCLSSCHVETQHINLNKLLPNPNFSIESHDFNIYGTCNTCTPK